ncbi:MAG: DUF5683 domain-containing protein [Chitinophagaceae bacterium]|nr:DUF5683 domain-containing protein [Chitinophagaceae bacterium]
MFKYYIFLLFFLNSFVGYTQTDSLPTNDTSNLHNTDPYKALIFSAVLPGLGQCYNKEYWKVPILYGAISVFGYLTFYYNGLYSNFEASLIAERDNDPTTVKFFTRRSTQYLELQVSTYRQQRNYMILTLCIIYALNLVDAHVAAHLSQFDVNDNISIRYYPKIQNTASPTDFYYGMSVSILFK